MTHAEAFTEASFEHESERTVRRIRACDQPLEYVGTSFHGDVHWTVYRCATCDVKVFTVGGREHWWNYEARPAEATS